MMNEKTMVSDALTGINGELKMYAEYISQSEDPQLKQTLKQMRNKAETAQEQLYQIAREKSYYVPAKKASKEEIDHVKSLFKPESMLYFHCRIEQRQENILPRKKRLLYLR